MKVKLKDISITKGSYGINASAVDKVSQKQVSYLRITDIDEFGNIRSKNMKTVDSKDYEKYLLQKNDIVFARTGNSVGKNYFYDERDGKLVYAGFLVKFSLNEDKVYPKYFKYFAQTNKCQGWIKNMASDGSTRPNINAQQLGNIELDLPVYSRQKSIADKLSIIDDKMRLNEQINANLYEQIKTISNSHFSYFDFSDGHIPSNWHYTSLSDVAEITTGYSYTSRELHSSKTAMATIKNFERTGGFSDKGYKEIIPQKKLKDSKIARKFDILVAHTDLTQNADIIGNAEIILDTSIYSQLIYSMDLVRVRTKATNVSQFLLSLILQGDRLKKHCLGYVNGTTVLHLSKKALKEFYIPLPNDLHELDHISKFAKTAYMNIAINIQENSMLQEAKQTLLRKFF